MYACMYKNEDVIPNIHSESYIHRGFLPDPYFYIYYMYVYMYMICNVYTENMYVQFIYLYIIYRDPKPPHTKRFVCGGLEEEKRTNIR